MGDSLAGLQVLYLTTIGRTTGLPREIEIWFVLDAGKFYIFAEHHRRAHWVQNVERNPQVHIRVGERRITASGRVLDPVGDSEAWHRVQDLARQKYGWGEGLPVEFIPDERL